MKQIYEKPKTPNAAKAAMSVLLTHHLTEQLTFFTRLAMGAVQDPKLAEETFQYILTKARDQDLHTFFTGLRSNPVTRRPLAKFFMDNYASVRSSFPQEWL
jgi:hypothetical protein